MLLWAAVTVMLIIGLIIGLTWQYPQEFIAGTSYLLLLVTLGILYRVLRCMKTHKVESILHEVEILKRENQLLRAKLSEKGIEYRELGIFNKQRTNKEVQ